MEGEGAPEPSALFPVVSAFVHDLIKVDATAAGLLADLAHIETDTYALLNNQNLSISPAGLQVKWHQFVTQLLETVIRVNKMRPAALIPQHFGAIKNVIQQVHSHSPLDADAKKEHNQSFLELKRDVGEIERLLPTGGDILVKRLTELKAEIGAKHSAFFETTELDKDAVAKSKREIKRAVDQILKLLGDQKQRTDNFVAPSECRLISKFFNDLRLKSDKNVKGRSKTPPARCVPASKYSIQAHSRQVKPPTRVTAANLRSKTPPSKRMSVARYSPPRDDQASVKSATPAKIDAWSAVTSPPSAGSSPGRPTSSHSSASVKSAVVTSRGFAGYSAASRRTPTAGRLMPSPGLKRVTPTKGTSPGASRGTSPGVTRGTSPGVARGTSPGVARGTSPGVARGVSPGAARGSATKAKAGTSVGTKTPPSSPARTSKSPSARSSKGTPLRMKPNQKREKVVSSKSRAKPEKKNVTPAAVKEEQPVVEEPTVEEPANVEEPAVQDKAVEESPVVKHQPGEETEEPVAPLEEQPKIEEPVKPEEPPAKRPQTSEKKSPASKKPAPKSLTGKKSPRRSENKTTATKPGQANDKPAVPKEKQTAKEEAQEVTKEAPVDAKAESKPDIEKQKPADASFDEADLQPVAVRMVNVSPSPKHEIGAGLEVLQRDKTPLVEQLPKDLLGDVTSSNVTAGSPSHAFAQTYSPSLQRKLQRPQVSPNPRNETMMSPGQGSRNTDKEKEAYLRVFKSFERRLQKFEPLLATGKKIKEFLELSKDRDYDRTAAAQILAEIDEKMAGMGQLLPNEQKVYNGAKALSQLCYLIESDIHGGFDVSNSAVMREAFRNVEKQIASIKEPRMQDFIEEQIQRLKEAKPLFLEFINSEGKREDIQRVRQDNELLEQDLERIRADISLIKGESANTGDNTHADSSHRSDLSDTFDRLNADLMDLERSHTTELEAITHSVHKSSKQRNGLITELAELQKQISQIHAALAGSNNSETIELDNETVSRDAAMSRLMSLLQREETMY